jgi:hypothetical protein
MWVGKIEGCEIWDTTAAAALPPSAVAPSSFVPPAASKKRAFVPFAAPATAAFPTQFMKNVSAARFSTSIELVV